VPPFSTNEYGKVPPVAVTVTAPVVPPLQSTLVSEVTVPAKVLLVFMMLKLVVAVHPPVVAVNTAV